MSPAASLYVALVPVGLVAGSIAVAAKLFPRVRGAGAVARCVAVVFLLGVSVAWVARLLGVGHLPLFGTYESALSLALATAAVGAAWDLCGRDGPVMPLASLVAAVVLWHGLAFDPTPYALTISERSWVVDVHAVLAWIAFGVLVVASLIALRVLLRRDSTSGERGGGLTTALSIGFFVHSGMMVSGSVYKFLLFGRAWSFDPVEVLGFATWVSYGALLHMRLLARWDERRLAAWTLATFVLLVASYRAIVYFPPWSTYHIFDMDRRVHVVEGEWR